MSGPVESEDVLGFQFVHKGFEIVREGDRQLMLTPGQIAIWDGATPTEIEIVKPFHKRTLLFPRQRLLSVCPRLGELRSLPSLDSSGPARLLVRYMNALAIESQHLSGAAAVSAANVALEFFALRSSPNCRPAGRPSAPLSAPRSGSTYALICRTPTWVPPRSRALSLFRCAPCTPCSRTAMSRSRLMVRNARLRRCLEDLQLRNGGSMTDIAFRWGFNDSAHFSRIFKRKFGVTPSEVRHATLTDS